MRKGAIFDMDGLLFDSERIYKNSWIRTAEHFGKERGAELAAMVSGAGEEGCRQAIKNFYPDVDVDKFFMHVVETAVKTFERDGVEMMAGVVEILELFKAGGAKIAVASSSDMNVITRNLERADIRKYFSAVVSGDDVANGKPAPDIFLKAAAEIGLAPEDCYVFEDSYNGIRGAAKAGCAPVMIPDTSPATDEMRELCAGIYPSLIDAAEAIRRNEI